MSIVSKISYHALLTVGMLAVVGSALVLGPQVSHAETASPEVGSSFFSQLSKVLESLEQQVAAIAASRDGSVSTVKPGCIDNKLTYKHGQTIPSLTLSNGIRSTSRGNEYRCDAGRWIFQGIPKASPTSTGSTTTSSGSANSGKCTAMSKSYNPGVEIRGWALVRERGFGSSNINSDKLAASYMCRNGSWIPIMANQATCKLASGVTVMHGTVSTSTLAVGGNRPGTLNYSGLSNRSDFATKLPLTCMNGMWKPYVLPCKVGNTMVFHGQTSTSSAAYQQYIASLPQKQRTYSSDSFQRIIAPQVMCQNGKFIIKKQESAADRR